MLHLSSERLAALADSEPTALEADHLAACVGCARERAANRSLLMMARAEREQLGMPLTRWDSLAPELHRAGLVAAGALMSALPAAADAEPPRRSGGARPAARWLQAAALLLLAGGGAAPGRLSAGASLLPSSFLAEAPDIPSPPPPPDPVPLAPVLDVTVSPTGETLLPEFSSVDEALVALRRYEVAYQHAAAYLADRDSTTRVVDDPDVYRARLAALDRAGRAMSEALREAPHDPVINGSYLATLGQRQATLRDLERVLPSGHRLRRF